MFLRHKKAHYELGLITDQHMAPDQPMVPRGYTGAQTNTYEKNIEVIT